MRRRKQPPPFDYSPWRHGGWYVNNVRYPTGACGCVSRNYEDGKWRIACDPRPDAYERFTYPTRDAAAQAELDLIHQATAAGALTYDETRAFFRGQHATDYTQPLLL